MFLRLMCSLLFASLTFSEAIAQTDDRQPKNPTEWFKRAYDAMDLRLPGAKPFHLKVTYHASPGLEFRGIGEKNEILSGDGTYEESWISVDQWRREVTLAGYHAIEVKSEAGGRKMQTSSEYEPSRILMLLDALYYPIQRNLVSKEFRDRGGSGWKLDHVMFGGKSLVRISKSIGDETADYTDAFVFQPHGLLNMRNFDGLSTIWTDYVPFAGNLVPRNLTIMAGDRELLKAAVTIEPLAHSDPDDFNLHVDQAEPGNTLRPLQFFEVRLPDLSDSFSWSSFGTARGKPVFSLRGVLDRRGRYRELEVIYAPSTEQAEVIMTHFRTLHHKPATIDGVPCEFVMAWAFM